MTIAEEYHPQRTPDGSPVRSSPIINRALLPIKGYYFVFMAAVGDLLPFIAVFMKHLGLNPRETGLIYGVMPFVGFFMRPLIGAFADKYHKHKFVLVVVTILTGLFYVLLVTVPKRSSLQPAVIKTMLKCNTQDSFLQECESSFRGGFCEHGFSSFHNTSYEQIQNETISCTLKCGVVDDESHEFRACFTNETGPIDFLNCLGMLSENKDIVFNVTDLGSILKTADVQHTQEGCRDYDLKDISYEKDIALQVLCDRELDFECTMTCPPSLDIKSCGEAPEAFDKSFFIFFFLFLMANIFFSPIFPILDAAAYDCLGEKRHLWGQQRIWGTFGFALFAITSTFIMWYKEQENEDVNLSISFYIFGPLCLISAIIAYFMKFSSEIRCGQFVKNVWKLLSYKEVSVFLLVIMYFGIVLGGLEAFLFWYLFTLNSSPLVFGLMLVVNCMAEMPMLWIAGGIIKRIGLVSCLYLALLCYAVRLLTYSLIDNPWYVLFVEPLHGVTFALMYAAASTYASIISPPGMSATVQGLLGGVHFGFGKGLGSFITGFLYDSIGPRWTWRFFAIISIVILVIYILLNVLVFTQRPPSAEQSKPADADEDDQQDDQLVDNGIASPNSQNETLT